MIAIITCYRICRSWGLGQHAENRLVPALYSILFVTVLDDLLWFFGRGSFACISRLKKTRICAWRLLSREIG